MKKCLVIVICFLFCLLGSAVVAAADDPQAIIEQADAARGKLSGVEWQLTIDSIENGKSQQRKLEVKAREFDFLAVLTAPPKVKGQKMLMVDHNMWFGKPGLKKPVPISPRQKLVGNAAYGDIAATNYSSDYAAEALPDVEVDGEPCYLFDLKALTKKTTYDRILYWVSKSRTVGVKAEYYTVSGKMIKTARFEYENTISDNGSPRPFISRMVITDALIKENVTSLDFSEPGFRDISDATFNLNLLTMN